MANLNGKQIIQTLANPGGALSQRVVISGVWMFFLRIAQKLLGIARLIILARIISPHDFGLMGIALLTMATLETFSQTGFETALIQKKDDIEPYLDTAWTISVIRGIFLFIILYLISPYIAFFFHSPETEPVIQVIGFSFLIQALTNTGVIYFQKELEFNKVFVYQFMGTLADFSVAVLSAIIFKNVWALVLGFLAGNIVRCFVSYFIHPYRPKFNAELKKVKQLWAFGKWILGSSILVFLLTQGDDLFVAKLLGATMLGFYQMAYKISNLPATEITSVLGQITYPAYSKLQDDRLKLNEFYIKIFQLICVIAIPITGIIFILAPEFTNIFLGEKWMPMVPAMQILSLYGMIRAISAAPGNIFMAVGVPDLRTKIQFFQLVLLAILIYPLTKYKGITGTSIAVLSYVLIFNTYAVYKVVQIIKLKYTKLLQAIFFPLMSTIFMSAVIYFLKNFVFMDIKLNVFIMLIVIGVLVYVFTLYLFELKYDYKVRALLVRKLRELINVYNGGIQ